MQQFYQMIAVEYFSLSNYYLNNWVCCDIYVNFRDFVCCVWIACSLSVDLFFPKGNQVKDPKFTTTATGKSSHHACTLDSASVGVKYLFLQLYYQQVALVIKEEFYKRNVLWRKAYVPDLFFPPICKQG